MSLILMTIRVNCKAKKIIKKILIKKISGVVLPHNETTFICGSPVGACLTGGSCKN
jgi:hypothetical protein